MLRPLRIGITTGDDNGIGPEVVSKALKKLGPQKNIQFILWRNKKFPRKDLLRISKTFKLVTVGSWAEALQKIPSSPKELLDICSDANPARCVEEAASACLFKHLDAMATAPMSKPLVRAAGLKDVGHTDILKRVANVKRAYMVFLGEKFNVMLLSGHLSLKDVASSVTAESLELGLREAQKLGALLGNKKPLGILGLNPHASDDGLIGNEERDVLIPGLEKARGLKINVEGPLVPDSAFTPDQWSRYSLYLAMYHDQGLIPFKTIHGQNGVHITWGLPFVRTSVDHGTAFDIAGKNKADSTSMRLAIEWAIKLAKEFS